MSMSCLYIDNARSDEQRVLYMPGACQIGFFKYLKHFDFRTQLPFVQPGFDWVYVHVNISFCRSRPPARA